MTRHLARGAFALLVALSGAGCTRSEPRAVAPFSLKGHRALVDTASPFYRRLEIVDVRPAPEKAQALRMVGQLIALANASGELSGSPVAWVELEPNLAKELGLELRGGVGQAYGLTTVPLRYLEQLHGGQRVQIARYGLRKTSTSGSIVWFRRQPGEPDLAQVVFSIPQGREWYPGTNCEVEFPLVKSVPVRVSKNSLLTHGLQEFTFLQVAPGEFEIKPVAVVGETADDVFVVGALKPGDRLIGRGAILLKPLVHDVPREAKGDDRVYP